MPSDYRPNKFVIVLRYLCGMLIMAIPWQFGAFGMYFRGADTFYTIVFWVCLPLEIFVTVMSFNYHKEKLFLASIASSSFMALLNFICTIEEGVRSTHPHSSISHFPVILVFNTVLASSIAIISFVVKKQHKEIILPNDDYEMPPVMIEASDIDSDGLIDPTLPQNTILEPDLQLSATRIGMNKDLSIDPDKRLPIGFERVLPILMQTISISLAILVLFCLISLIGSIYFSYTLFGTCVGISFSTFIWWIGMITVSFGFKNQIRLWHAMVAGIIYIVWTTIIAIAIIAVYQFPVVFFIYVQLPFMIAQSVWCFCAWKVSSDYLDFSHTPGCCCCT